MPIWIVRFGSRTPSSTASPEWAAVVELGARSDTARVAMRVDMDQADRTVLADRLQDGA